MCFAWCTHRARYATRGAALHQSSLCNGQEYGRIRCGASQLLLILFHAHSTRSGPAGVLQLKKRAEKAGGQAPLAKKCLLLGDFPRESVENAGAFGMGGTSGPSRATMQHLHPVWCDCICAETGRRSLGERQRPCHHTSMTLLHA
jgi:hypothetical protein